VYSIFIVIHILICIGLMISVLMQSAKGEGLAGAFGGSSLTGTVFGGRGAAPFLAKATSGLAVAFMLSCIVLTFLSPSRVRVAADGQPAAVESAVEKAARERAGEVPVQQPGTQPAVQPGEMPAGDASQEAPALPGTDGADQSAGQQQQTPPPEGGDEPENR